MPQCRGFVGKLLGHAFEPMVIEVRGLKIQTGERCTRCGLTRHDSARYVKQLDLGNLLDEIRSADQRIAWLRSA